MPSAPPNPRDTPAMRQYYRFKRQHPECVLLFRIGDFYEMFDDDAVKVSKAIGLTLTQRTEGVPMCGMPYHQLETYLRRLLEQGFRVAVCDQTQDASEVKPGTGAIIERAVTRVLTPGTLVDESLLDSDAPSTLAAVCFLEGGDAPTSPVAVAVVDLSTGRFEVFETPANQVADELARRRVTEMLYAQTADGSAEAPARVQAILSALGVAGAGGAGGVGTAQPSWHFRPDEAREALLKHYGVRTLDGFGLSDTAHVIRPAGAIIRYLQTTQMPGDTDAANTASRSLKHLAPPKREDTTSSCVLDGTTLRSLEVLRIIRAGSGPGSSESDGSLLGIFSASRTFTGCRTPMGKRLLREWLCRPLLDIAQITQRQKCVSTLVEDRLTAAALSDSLGGVQDIARIAARLALGRCTPRDLCALGRSLAQVSPVGEAISQAPAFARQHAAITSLREQLAPLAARIAEICVDDPPPHLREGGLFKDGVDPELDEARLLQRDAAQWMTAYQARLIEEHQLPSLKVGYNRIFGYYIELPSAQSKRAPDAFSRKQTLKNAERYITPELKEFETKVTTAESRALAREQALFDDLCTKCTKLIPSIGLFADTIAELDVLACFAEKASRRRWVKPEIVDEPALAIEQGRHPVLDERLESNFVPNDLELGGNSADQQPIPPLALITGPNMAGKSTFIRTAALLTLLAHTGSFVPADKAVIGLTDRIFTRIGADDALHAGQSTFMVEMTETARILNHCTQRSLIILDEIGRGTSTLDGLSLAWAIAETLAGDIRPRTLFATHYHELTDLEELLPGRVRNLHVSVREWGEDIVFLHRILPGRTDQSYGIHVAKLAGLPPKTVARAREVLENLAVHHHGSATSDKPEAKGKSKSKSPPPPPPGGQLALFTEYVQHPAVDHLREIKIDALSPLQAFDALRKLKEMTERKG